jgi:hypothetical protein
MYSAGDVREKISIVDLLVNKSFNLDKHGQSFVVRSDDSEEGTSRRLVKISKEQIVFDGIPCDIIYLID